MATKRTLTLMSLREQVYELLRVDLESGELRAGQSIKLDQIAEQMGVSRTPLRDALLRLEVEGFVTIRPRSGVEVRRLTERDIRNLYEMIGALEAAVLRNEHAALTPDRIATMSQANADMSAALAVDDFGAYYAANLSLHDAYIGMSSNVELVQRLKIMKQRLYDFPRRSEFVKEWEVASTGEHEQIVTALARGDVREAARVVQDVHWSFDVQERFIRRYYLKELEQA